MPGAGWRPGNRISRSRGADHALVRRRAGRPGETHGGRHGASRAGLGASRGSAHQRDQRGQGSHQGAGAGGYPPRGPTVTSRKIVAPNDGVFVPRWSWRSRLISRFMGLHRRGSVVLLGTEEDKILVVITTLDKEVVAMCAVPPVLVDAL